MCLHFNTDTIKKLQYEVLWKLTEKTKLLKTSMTVIGPL